MSSKPHTVGYIVTHVAHDGSRVMSAPARQARWVHNTREEAEHDLQNILTNPFNNRETLEGLFSDLSKMAVRKIKCHQGLNGNCGDPCSINIENE